MAEHRARWEETQIISDLPAWLRTDPDAMAMIRQVKTAKEFITLFDMLRARKFGTEPNTPYAGDTPMLSHITREGREVPLSGMTDDHLTKTICFLLRPVAEKTQAIDATAGGQTPRARALYGEVISDDDYRLLITRTYQKVGPYVLEAALRGLLSPLMQDDDTTSSNLIRAALIAAFGRDSKDGEAPDLEGRVTDEHTLKQLIAPNDANSGSTQVFVSDEDVQEIDVDFTTSEQE